MGEQSSLQGGGAGQRNRHRGCAVVLGLGLLASSQVASAQDGGSNADQVSEAGGSGAKDSVSSGETWSVVPAVLPGYQPETSFLLGGAAILAHQYPKEAKLRESQVMLAGAASVRKQFTILLQPDLYLLDERLHVGGKLSASRFPDYFYGIGISTRLADEEEYVANFYEIEVSPKPRVLEGAYLGPSVRVERVDVTKTDPEGQLAERRLAGSSGGLGVELGISALVDTRDSALYPGRGGLLRLRGASARSQWGSDFPYDSLRFDARYYLTMPWASHVLAVQSLVDFRRGQPPFYGLGRLGGAEMLRGYYEGRYRERQYVAAQTEYRMPIVWRLGVVAFLATGTVARHVRDLRARTLKVSSGGGLRLAPLKDVPVNVRLDAGFGDAWNFYFGLGEAF